MTPQPMIAVKDVPASSRWYQAVLGLHSGHVGPEYELLLAEGRLALQLHHWDTHEHPHFGDPTLAPRGNGAELWFHERAIDAAYRRAVDAGALVLEALHVNPLAGHREFWLRDADGYVIVVAGDRGDVGT